MDAVTNHGRLGGSKQQMYSRTALEIRSLALRLSTGSCYLQRLGGIHSSLLPGSLRCPWLEAYPVVSPVFILPPPLCTLVSSHGLNRSTNANPVRAKPRVQVASPVCMELVLGEDPSSHFLSSCCYKIWFPVRPGVISLGFRGQIDRWVGPCSWDGPSSNNVVSMARGKLFDRWPSGWAEVWQWNSLAEHILEPRAG